MNEMPVQDRYAPKSICFGCGPANADGLRIKSHRREGGLITRFMPAAEHQAFPGVVSGGIIGTLIDCHGNWTAAVALMDAGHFDELPPTVTAHYSVNLRRPAPADGELVLTSHVDDLEADRAHVSVTVTANGKEVATGEGLFVAVPEGHPAYHRW